MENLEISAKTVEEAIQIALKELGARRNEVSVTVLNEGKTGILGLGSEEARVLVERLSPEDGEEYNLRETARQVLEKLLDMMDVEGEVMHRTIKSTEDNNEPKTYIGFDIQGDDLGIIIGRRGQTLACLQYILRLIVGHQTKTWEPIVLDVEGYKQRRQESLKVLAKRVAQQVKERKTSFTLEPMPAYERRIIHLTLATDPELSTVSIGQGESRKVVVQYQRKYNI